MNKAHIKPFIPLIFTIFLALLLFYLVQDFLRTVIIGPLLYIAWFIGLVVESIPQGLIWAGFILIMLIIAFASLRKSSSQELHREITSLHKVGKVEKWARILDHAQKDRFTKWRLADELNRFNRKLLSENRDNNGDPNQTEAQLPAEIQAYFDSKQPTKIPFSDWFSSITEENYRTDKSLDLDPEVVIKYFEDRR